MTILIPIVVIVVMAAIGIGASLYTKKDDGQIEEFAENVIEDELEDVLHLPEGSEKGKIDLTPNSKEMNDA